MRLNRIFFARDARIVAQELLGKTFVRVIDNIELRCMITETEAYIGEIDKACHAYGMKRTAKVEPLYGEPGITYIYFIYGLYHCFNLITKEINIPEGVLIRAVEPLNNFDYISNIRFKKIFDQLTKTQIKTLTNGPSKFAMAYRLTRNENLVDTITSDEIYLEDSSLTDFEIVKTKRIGIDYAEEAKDFLWRYYIKGNNFISKK
ncbi:DNA-3-methyladenine glycosylase [uncultured Clostridium sp.]|uniref:DNA-3-methyladenine glycosylase n=1 Tax=uncultured Clostridium sp. TaxID=59620 RepID=UPI0026129089|nr:DNA-3-methyladenine glycosylase [uncultured Clostridium sp.]